MNERYVGAIDQGTTSTRFFIFNRSGEIVASAQEEHRQIFPKPGWVEHDPIEIWEKTQRVIRSALAQSGKKGSMLVALGITNQRETTLVWDPTTGKPLHNAIVWQDVRTNELLREIAPEVGGMDGLRKKTGLPLASYFSGPKMTWLIDNVRNLQDLIGSGQAVFGTIDSWLIWNLTGGVRGGKLVTDVTNASRTLLMDLKSLDWDQALLDLFAIPRNALPEIQPSISKIQHGSTRIDGPFEAEVPITGILGDQQAAMFGQGCFKKGMGKCTYGTGCFMLANTGEEPVQSRHGLLTTLLYKHGDSPPVYALEGSVAVAGSLVQWVRDNLGLIKASGEIEVLANEVSDSGGVYFVPAFAGLFAPYWHPQARGIIAGLSGHTRAAHIARAVLESTAFQTRDLVAAMEKDTGVPVNELKGDGGMVVNPLLMQFQADILDVPVILPIVTETTALGAAYAAGLSEGYWSSLDEIATQWGEGSRFTPNMSKEEREERLHYWDQAIARTMNWME